MRKLARDLGVAAAIVRHQVHFSYDRLRPSLSVQTQIYLVGMEVRKHVIVFKRQSPEV
jgi:hypothetical protein